MGRTNEILMPRSGDAKLPLVPQTPTAVEIDPGPLPPTDDDWSYGPSLEQVLDALEMEIVDEDDKNAPSTPSSPGPGQP